MDPFSVAQVLDGGIDRNLDIGATLHSVEGDFYFLSRDAVRQNLKGWILEDNKDCSRYVRGVAANLISLCGFVVRTNEIGIGRWAWSVAVRSDVHVVHDYLQCDRYSFLCGKKPE